MATNDKRPSSRLAALNFLLLVLAEVVWSALGVFRRAAHRLNGAAAKPVDDEETGDLIITEDEWRRVTSALREPPEPERGGVALSGEALEGFANQLDAWIRKNAGTGVVPWAQVERNFGLRGWVGAVALAKLLREGRVAAIPDGLHPCEARGGEPCAPR